VVEPSLHSKKTTEAIDDEIRAVVDAGMDRARAILVAHGDVLARLAHALLEQESISGEELERVFRIEPGAALAGPSPA
jgi:cell division protease FtsH